MPVEVVCVCGQRFSADERYLGKQAKCTGCGNILTIQPANKPAAKPAASAQPIVVACQCGARFAAKPELAGKTVACPQCKQPLTIGASPAAPRPQPVAAPILQPDPFGNSLWDDLPPAGGSLGPATSMPGSKSLGAALPSKGASFGGGRRKLGFDLMAGRAMSEVVAGVILSILAMLGGGGLTYALMYLTVDHGDSTKWPNVSGTITTSAVIEDGFAKRGRQKYRAQIQFAYQVNGVPHTSDRIAVYPSVAGNNLTPQIAVNKYPPGSTHPVYYKPEDASFGVLETGDGPGGYIMGLMALGLVLIGGIGLTVSGGALAYRCT